MLIRWANGIGEILAVAIVIVRAAGVVEGAAASRRALFLVNRIDRWLFDDAELEGPIIGCACG